MSGALSKDRQIFDPADAAESDNTGAYLRAGSDGDLISSTNLGGKEALDVNPIGGPDLGIFAEDDAHASGDKGQFVLAVRQDADASLVGTDGDYAPLQVDENGRLKVVADIEVANGFEKVEDEAHSSGDVGAFVMGVAQASLAASVDADGDYTALKSNARGALWTAPVGTVADDAADTENPIKVGTRAINAALAALSAANDRADMISDLYRRVMINDAPNRAVKSSTVTISTTATLLPATALAGRTRIMVQNTSNSDIYVGGSDVTTANGLVVAKGATLSLDLGEFALLYGIVGAGTAGVRAFELA